VKKLYFMHKFMCARNQKAAEALETPISTPLVTADETVHHLAVCKSRDVPKSARVSADTEALDHEEGNPWPYMTDFYKFLTRNAVFQIRDVLIRIRGSDPYLWITDPALFFSGFQIKRPTKNIFFCFFLNIGTFTSALKDNQLLRSHKTVEIKVFLSFLAC
jgi:hypothetical protein